MKQSLSSIVDEIIALEPSLADRRDDVTRIVKELLDARMDTRWRSAFQKELLQTLRERMGGKEDAPTFSSSFLSLFMESRFLFAGGGAVLGALLVFVFLQQPNGAPAPVFQDEHMEMMSINTVAPKAFGSLAQQNSAATGLGGGATNEAAMSSRPQSGGGGGGTAMTDSMMIAPEEYYQTRYVFDGDILLPAGDINVYKRIEPKANVSATSAIADFARNMINWSALGSSRVQNVSVISDGREQYSVHVDYNGGSLSISRMYDPNSNPHYNCQDSDCWERLRLREGDMLSDAEAIRIAQSFIDKFGIDVSQYGEPVLYDDWRIMYARTEDKASYYFPEQVSIVFPFSIDGQPVYEEYGNPYGMTVGVDIRTKSVSSVYNLYVYNLDQSSYPAMQDVERVRSVVEHGSMYMWDDPNARKDDARLGEPTRAFMRTYQWSQEKGASSELYVPALVFPVTEPAERSHDNRKNVVVPLAEEFYQKQDDVMVPRPLPLMREMVEEAVQ